MIAAEFLVCDDLGPLGRLVAPTEALFMEPDEIQLIVNEREWIGVKFTEAERKAAAYRRMLKTAHLGGEAKRNAVREWFDIWTIEAAKYAVCDNWLLSVIGRLETGQPMAMEVPKDFHWNRYGPIRELVQKVVSATDEEILNGARFRV